VARNPSDLAVFAGKRLLQLLAVLFGVVTITFFFTHIAIPNPCYVWSGPRATDATIQLCIHNNDLDKPPLTQYLNYLGKLVSGDWGRSDRGVPVLPSILEKFPQTLELVLFALVLMVILGIPLGVVAANNSGRWADHLVRTFYLSGWATPTYLGGVILSIAIGPFFGLPRTGAFGSIPTFPEPFHVSVLDALVNGNLPAALDAFLHLILPASALAFINLGIATRMTRTSMLEVLPMDYVKTAKIKGLSDFAVLYKHALRNSLISTVTVLGITAGGLLSTTVVIEEIFQWPGVGSYAFEAITKYNFNGTIGVVIFFAVGVVLANLIADTLYGLLDPRVEWR
jgi:ABC-type dipeptide/oligopeptide/nickel transport system permease component